LTNPLSAELLLISGINSLAHRKELSARRDPLVAELVCLCSSRFVETSAAGAVFSLSLSLSVAEYQRRPMMEAGLREIRVATLDHRRGNDGAVNAYSAPSE